MQYNSTELVTEKDKSVLIPSTETWEGRSPSLGSILLLWLLLPPIAAGVGCFGFEFSGSYNKRKAIKKQLLVSETRLRRTELSYIDVPHRALHLHTLPAFLRGFG